jgi:hypothetical protein
VGDGEREAHGDRGVDGVTAGSKYLEADFGSVGFDGDHHALFGAHGVSGPGGYGGRYQQQGEYAAHRTRFYFIEDGEIEFEEYFTAETLRRGEESAKSKSESAEEAEGAEKKYSTRRNVDMEKRKVKPSGTEVAENTDGSADATRGHRQRAGRLYSVSPK